MNIKETYNLIAEDWHKDHQSDDWWLVGTDKFVSLVTPGGHVLDVGCGAGTKSKYLTSRNFKVTGIDLSDKMIEIAKRENLEINFKVLDLASVDELNDLYDGIFMQAVLLHVPKAEALSRIQALSKKLKTGGYFYIAVKDKRPGGPDEEMVMEDDYGYQYERFFSYYDLEEITNYFKNSGLTPVYEYVYSSGKRGWVQVIARKD